MSGKVSIIIPTYQEESSIVQTIKCLRELDGSEAIHEIIVVDASSKDGTVQLARAAGAKVLETLQRKRSTQMNLGAEAASAEILYFLHADTFPPKNIFLDIDQAVNNGFIAGCCRLNLDSDHFFLKVICWMTRFDIDAFRYGDQSLFILKNEFEKLGGFDQELIIMEDFDMVKRIRKQGKFKILPSSVTSSARKFRLNGEVRLMLIFLKIFLLYRIGVSQKKLVEIYQKNISDGKIALNPA